MKVEKVKLFVEIGILAAAAAHKRGPLIIMGDFQKCRKKEYHLPYPFWMDNTRSHFLFLPLSLFRISLLFFSGHFSFHFKKIISSLTGNFIALKFFAFWNKKNLLTFVTAKSCVRKIDSTFFLFLSGGDWSDMISATEANHFVCRFYCTFLFCEKTTNFAVSATFISDHRPTNTTQTQESDWSQRSKRV